MGRRAAIALHVALVLFGTVLYVVFVLPRWWVFTGDIPSTLATVGRIAAGLPIAAAAVPVWQVLQRALRPSARTPELALRLRAWSAVLHVVAGGLILLAAITEIWLSLGAAGPWLFGVYGAAAAIAILAVAAFALSFVAEKPPGPAKPPKAPKAKKEKKPKKKRGTTPDAETGDVTESDESPETTSEPTPESNDDADAPDTDSAPETDNAEVVGTAAPATGGLRNKRLSTKNRIKG